MEPIHYSSNDMWWGTLGTVRPFSNFHPDQDVMEIHNALDRKDVGTLVNILTNRNNAQRQVIAAEYKQTTNKDLIASLKKALSGDLEDLLLDLMMLPEHFDAQRLQDAMAGLGTDEEGLMEILSTRSREQLQHINNAFQQRFKKDLEKELRGETSGDFAKLVVALLKKADSPALVQKDVEALAASLSGKKANAAPWIEIMTSRNSAHLNNVLMELELQLGQPVEQTLEKRFSGDFQMGLKVLVQCIQSPEVYLAKRLSTMKTSMVHGIMVSHCEEDLLCIRAAFLKLTGNSLYSALQKHFKGEHLQALLGICRSED
ncbi:annexin A2 [Oryzias melastigma]|uniref:Annexin n=1 Tax=Oryzias melastigma TaxID=30732 RepID=A0A3B3BK78_ORYME|nr:annexin A2 [Oryzias melastigma]XP_036070272.1 annexin A2 [Oryzias melastigma]